MDSAAGQSKPPRDSSRLSVDIHHRVGVLTIEVKFHLTHAWTVLFGPSGSGKSTILRVIGSAKPPKQRIPLAPQSPSLFPHWTVLENLTMRRNVAQSQAVEMLSLFRLEGLKDKRPSQLSGGEAQRVNVARAATWATQGGLLLLDEPFTGMDIALRDEIMRGMQVWANKRDVSVFSVTHDVAEAFQLGAEVIKIADGKVVAQGPVEIVLAEERERLLKQLSRG